MGKPNSGKTKQEFTTVHNCTPKTVNKQYTTCTLPPEVPQRFGRRSHFHFDSPKVTKRALFAGISAEAPSRRLFRGDSAIAARPTTEPSPQRRTQALCSLSCLSTSHCVCARCGKRNLHIQIYVLKQK